MKRKIGYVFLSTLVIVVSLFVILSAAIVLFEPAMHAMGTFICPGGDLISQKRTIATTTRSLEDCTSKNYSPEGHCLADSVIYYCRGDMQRRPVILLGRRYPHRLAQGPGQWEMRHFASFPSR